MKTYREAMDGLSFTDEQKQAMTNRLLVETPRAAPRKRPVRRLAVGVAIAAVLALTVTAGAAGGLSTAAEALAGLFGSSPAQTEVIDHIGYPVGASDTDNGVTVTADAILADRYSYAVVYSVVRADGSPLFEDLEDPLTVQFDDWDLDVADFQGGGHGTCYFTDLDPADPAIQFVDTMTLDAPLPQGTAKASLAGLHRIEYDENTGEIRKADSIPGRWNLAFEFRTEDCSLDLPAGQPFHVNGMDATLDDLVLAPLSIQVDYTVDSEVTWNYEADPQHDHQEYDRYFGALPLLIHLKDGSVVDMTYAGGSVDPVEGKTVCQKGEVFETILPPEDVVSVTVGDIEIPVG